MNIEKLQDRKELTFFTGLNPSENKPVSNASSWKKYLLKNIVVGIELELDWTNGEVSDRILVREFGMRSTCYHEYLDCGRCEKVSDCLGANSGNTLIKKFFCHTILRNNGIVAIQEDSSIEGLEFLFQGTNETTEEFIEKLPIQKLATYFTPTFKNGIHTHILMPFLKKPIPTIMLKNLWQLYRKYYPAIIYLSGTTPDNIVRDNEYSRFSQYLSTALTRNLGGLGCERDGLYFGNINQEKMLDVEVRSFDSSLNAFHIALCRFLTRSLFIRAVELSEYGLVQIAKGKKWENTKKIIEKLNNQDNYYTQSEREFMKDLAEELYIELNHLLTPIERNIFKEYIEKPIWRGNMLVTPKKLEKKQIKALTKQITMLVTVKAFFDTSRSGYYSKLANTLNTSPNYIRKILSKIGASWNKELQTFEVA